MRLAHFAALAAALAPSSWAQATGTPAAHPSAPSAHAVASAQAPTAPLHHLPLPASGAMADGTDDWKAANAAVGQFPRGHADIVRWEAAQRPASAPAMPRGGHPHHHGQHGGRP